MLFLKATLRRPSTLLITLIISLLFNSSHGLAKVLCQSNRPIVFTQNNKQMIKKLGFCTDYPRYKIISLDCLKNENCEALKRYEHSKLPLLISDFGNPLHHKCTILGGNPAIVSVKIDNKDHETALCFFKDGSFISVFNDL